MQKLKSTFISDDHQRSFIPKTEPVVNLFRIHESDYQNKGEEMLTINKNIPDDHLTATYWG